MDNYNNGSLFRGGVDNGIIIFILCVEMLASIIRQNKNITGISIGETRHTI